jgi:hypothetical protein
LQVAWQEWREFFYCSSRVWYLPRVILVEKITLATKLCTWSPSEVVRCLASSVCNIKNSDWNTIV